jgi:GNAT superfamily N-acetyltransferase
MSLTIRTTSESDWESVRALRLEMLADTPIAFAETLETALTVDEDDWRTRAARGAHVAIDDGRWVGTMGCYIADGSPLLVGVYVTPDARGTGVAEALLTSIEHWAREWGDTLLLHVHADNARAIRFYEKQGYAATGVTVPYVLNEAETELEMAKRL